MTETPTSTDPIEIEILASIEAIPASVWNRFVSETSVGGDNPFLQHGFLAALEASGCTKPATGWAPAHLTLYHKGHLVGVIPAYRKSHSRGEYVFDWGWADAYQRHGLPYYPKLLLAVPFTPSVGPRLLLDADFRNQLTPARITDILTRAARELGCHSWHLLFPNGDDQALLTSHHSLPRLGCQFHWFNRGYRDFDEFLAALTSRKRKSIRRERRQVAEQGLEFHTHTGAQIPDAALEAFFIFYQATYFKRGQQPYLNLDFFRKLRDALPDQLALIMVTRDDHYIAGSLFLMDGNTLYGRYWGCLADYEFLHFETCYYRGIELAIELGLNCFDAGAQGEHKLIRGFEPVLTHSRHWVAHPDFYQAIARFLEEEATQVLDYYHESADLLPYRNESGEQP